MVNVPTQCIIHHHDSELYHEGIVLLEVMFPSFKFISYGCINTYKPIPVAQTCRLMHTNIYDGGGLRHLNLDLQYQYQQILSPSVTVLVE